MDGRRSEIMALLRERQEISVTELAEHFQTSAITIRRDLRFLEERMLIERFYGGARLLEPEKPLTREEEIGSYRDLISCAAAKLSAESALRLCRQGVLRICRYLRERRGGLRHPRRDRDQRADGGPLQRVFYYG